MVLISTGQYILNDFTTHVGGGDFCDTTYTGASKVILACKRGNRNLRNINYGWPLIDNTPEIRE